MDPTKLTRTDCEDLFEKTHLWHPKNAPPMEVELRGMVHDGKRWLVQLRGLSGKEFNVDFIMFLETVEVTPQKPAGEEVELPDRLKGTRAMIGLLRECKVALDPELNVSLIEDINSAIRVNAKGGKYGI